MATKKKQEELTYDLSHQVFTIRIKGVTPLMHHKMPDDQLLKLLNPKTAITDIGDENRTPRDIADKHAYKNGDGTYYIPSEYIMKSLLHVSSDYKQTRGKRSYKSLICGLFNPIEQEVQLVDEKDNAIKDFEVDIRKATNFMKGAIATCRPRFDEWEAEFSARINTKFINSSLVKNMLDDAGIRAGIGSYRVANNGWFGQYIVTKFLKEKA